MTNYDDTTVIITVPIKISDIAVALHSLEYEEIISVLRTVDDFIGDWDFTRRIWELGDELREENDDEIDMV